MPKSRISSLDVAKGIAMICIILGHTHFSKEAGHVMFTFHVPIFLLIIGYFINRKQTVLAFTKKRLRAVMLPYFVTCAAVIVLNVLDGLRFGTALTELIYWSKAAVYGSGNEYNAPFEILAINAIWFLPASCLASILFRCVLELPDRWRAPAVGALFAAGYLSSACLFWFPMSIQAGCCSVLFLYLGWLFRQNEDRLKALSREAKITATLVGTVIWIFFILNYTGYYIVRNYYGKSAFDTVGSVCACCIVLMISYWIDKKSKIFSRLFRFAGRYSLLILCVHGVEQNVIKWKEWLARFSIFLPAKTYNNVMALWRPTVILLAAWILLKIPAVRKLFGYDRVNA